MIVNVIVVSAMVVIAIRQVGLLLEAWESVREGPGRDRSGVSLTPVVDLGLAVVASLALLIGDATIFSSSTVAWLAVWGLALWTIVKDCGAEGDGLLSFPRSGMSLALYAAMALGAVEKRIRGQ